MYQQTYKKTMSDSLTSQPTETLMVMLYDGMIMRIKQARERFHDGEKIKAKESLIRAMQIADALMEHLNMEEGGETAQNLERLYYFVIDQLSRANREDHVDASLDNALRVLEILQEGWKQLEGKVKGPHAAA